MACDYCSIKRKSPGLTHAKAGTAKSAERMRPLEVFDLTGKAEVKQPKKWDTAVRSQEGEYQHEWVWMQGTTYENLMRKFGKRAIIRPVRIFSENNVKMGKKRS